MSEPLIHPDWIDKALMAGNGLGAVPALGEAPEGHDMVVAHAEVGLVSADVVVLHSPNGQRRLLWVESYDGPVRRGWWKDRYPGAKLPQEATDGGQPFTALQVMMRDGNIVIPNRDGRMAPLVTVLVEQLRAVTAEDGGSDMAAQPVRMLPPMLSAFLLACTCGLESPVHRQPPALDAPVAPTMPDDLKTAMDRYEGWVKEYRTAKDEAERLEGVASHARFEADYARRKADRMGRHAADFQREYAALVVKLAAVPS